MICDVTVREKKSHPCHSRAKEVVIAIPLAMETPPGHVTTSFRHHPLNHDIIGGGKVLPTCKNRLFHIGRGTECS